MATQVKQHRHSIPPQKAPKMGKYDKQRKGVKLLAERGKTRLIPQNTA